MVQVHAFANGRVQGVNFRYSVYRRATELGLKGSVRNLDDGRVEVLACGPQESVHKLLGYMRGNPGLSSVAKIDVLWEEPSIALEGFHIGF